MQPHLPPNLIGEFNNGNDKIRGRVCVLLAPHIIELIHEQMDGSYSAPDLAQEVFLKFLKKKRTYDSMRHLENYVRKVAISVCSNEKRKRKSRQSHAPKISNYLTDLQSRNVENRRNIRIFQRLTDLAVEMLPPRSKKVYIHSYCEGLSIKETADLMQISISTVENQRNFLFKKLRIELDEKPGNIGSHLYWWICIPFLIFYMLVQKLLS
jgi:RNA polymerase sigma factor (sigma-70 family)